MRTTPGGNESLTINGFPIPPSDAALALGRLEQSLVPPGGVPTWDLHTALCGHPGLMLTEPATGELPQGDDVVEFSGNAVYLFQYRRAAGVRSDPAVVQFMHDACPTSLDSISNLVPPGKWNPKSMLIGIARWQGPDGEDLTLQRVPRSSVRATTADLASPSPSERAQRQYFTVCGDRGFQIETHARVGPRVGTSTMIAIHGHDADYLFVYHHFAPANPQVVAAMHAYCPPGELQP